MTSLTFTERFLATFQSGPFQALARQTKWFKRQGKIDAFEFFIAQVFGQMSALRQTLVSLGQGFQETVTRQAVDQRYNQEGLVFFQEAFRYCLDQTLDWTPEHSQAMGLKAHFSAVYLLDSTGFGCAESLKDIFPSCGGAASSANIKVFMEYELISGRLQPVNVLEGKRSDQGQALKMAQRLKPNELKIQDKGFTDSKAWEAAFQSRAYLLMPLAHSVSLSILQSDGSEIELDLARELKGSSEAHLQWPLVTLGKGKHRTRPLRLIAFRLSEESASRHRSGLRESMRKKGHTPTAKALELAGWLLLITNAPEEKLPSSMVAYLYRVRWQIELIFRQIKSVLRLNKTESRNPYRVQCEIWARLVCAILLFLWHTHANSHCWRRYKSEISFEKVIRIMQQWGHSLALAFFQGSTQLLDQLNKIWKQILVNARKGRQKKRTNTWDHLLDLWLDPKKAAQH